MDDTAFTTVFSLPNSDRSINSGSGSAKREEKSKSASTSPSESKSNTPNNSPPDDSDVLDIFALCEETLRAGEEAEKAVWDLVKKQNSKKPVQKEADNKKSDSAKTSGKSSTDKWFVYTT